MNIRDWFRLRRFHSGQWVDLHDGPGGPLVPAVLVEHVSGPDSHGIEVWIVEYENRLGVKQRRALPCQCEHCKGVL